MSIISQLFTSSIQRTFYSVLKYYIITIYMNVFYVNLILSISEKRWQIEECFRIMKTEFEARPVFLQRADRITSHFLTCFLALIIYRYLEKFLEHKYKCEEILKNFKDFNFAYVKEQGFIHLYKRTELTDKLHEICHFNTDFEFITKSQMRTIKKQSKGK